MGEDKFKLKNYFVLRYSIKHLTQGEETDKYVAEQPFWKW